MVSLISGEGYVRGLVDQSFILDFPAYEDISKIIPGQNLGPPAKALTLSGLHLNSPLYSKGLRV